MNWTITTKHQTTIEVKGRIFDIICETDCDGDIALIIEGEYICDIENLPTYKELLEYIDQQVTLNEMASMSFPRS